MYMRTAAWAALSEPEYQNTLVMMDPTEIPNEG
jgi:hypothetical protein